MPDGSAVGSVSGGCVEGAVYELAETVVADGTPVLQRFGFSDEQAFAVGPDVRRHHRHLRRAGLGTDVPRPRSPGRRRARGPTGRDRHGDRAPRPRVGRPPAGRAAERTDVEGTLGLERADAAVADDARGLLAAGASAGRHLRPRGRADGHRHAGLRVVLPAGGPHDRLRCDRLRRRRRAPGQAARLRRHGVRRPPRVRDPRTLPGGRRRGRLVAAPLPASARSRPTASTAAPSSAC